MFSQLDVDGDSFPLDEIFFAFIVIGLIRDNEGAVYQGLFYFPHW